MIAGILVKIPLFPDGRKWIRALQSLASDDFHLLREQGPDDPALLSTWKKPSWDSRLEVLDWAVNANELSVTIPSFITNAETVSSDGGVAVISHVGVGKTSFRGDRFSTAYLVWPLV